MELFPFYFLWSWVLLTSTWRHKEIRVLQEVQSDGPWNIKALLLSRHKITFLQIILWKAGRRKTHKEIPSPQLLDLWKWQGQVSCRTGFCYTVPGAAQVLQLCWLSESLCWCSLVRATATVLLLQPPREQGQEAQGAVIQVCLHYWTWKLLSLCQNWKLLRRLNAC